MARDFNIFMEKIILFQFIAFGDFKNQMETLFFLGMSHSWTRTDRFFSCSFPPSDISKSFKYHKTDLVISEEIVPNKMKLKNLKSK